MKLVASCIAGLLCASLLFANPLNEFSVNYLDKQESQRWLVAASEENGIQLFPPREVDDSICQASGFENGALAWYISQTGPRVICATSVAFSDEEAKKICESRKLLFVRHDIEKTTIFCRKEGTTI